MFLVMYDIENDKLRTKFAKFLTQYGIRIQFSVFKIENSNRILDNIKVNIQHRFEPKFKQSDSVLIFQIPDTACIAKFGYSVDDEGDLIIR